MLYPAVPSGNEPEVIKEQRGQLMLLLSEHKKLIQHNTTTNGYMQPQMRLEDIMEEKALLFSG